jgi:hypothetical protein
MRKLLFLLALAAACGAAGTALAGNGNGGNPHEQSEPTPAVTEILSKVRVDPAQVPGLGRPLRDGEQRINLTPAPITAADCGACIEQCWYVMSRSGSSDWSGHAWIYQQVYWCGNGAWITSGSYGQWIDQSGWYEVTGQYGPWQVGGGVGAYDLTVAGYITWNWRSPFIGYNHSDTSWLHTTVYAYGGANAS